MKREKPFFESSFFAAVGGLLLTFLFYKIVLPKLSYISIFARLFLSKGGWYQKGVPMAITFLFFWSLTDLVIKLLIISNERLALKKLAQEFKKIELKEDIETLFNKFKNAKGMIYRRICYLLNEILLNKPLQDIREYLKYQSEIDADIATSEYTALRVFIWAMPILGFIGTVIGISIAVGNFSTFLTGDIENIDLVKRELAKIATGLSYAFDTTLLGLVASLVIMLLTSFIQNRKEKVLTTLDELCLNFIGDFVPRTFEKDINVSLVETLKTFKQDIIDSFNLSTNNFANSIESLYSNLETLKESEKEVISNFEYIKRSFEIFKESLDTFNQISQTLLEKFSSVQSGLRTQINQLETSTTALAKSTDSLRSISDNNLEVVKKIETFGQNLEELNKNVSSNLLPLLKRITGPLELKLVPIQPNPVETEKEGGEKDA